jgi:hypothetical protein
MEHLRVNFGVICDEVRREDNGKLLFIGVYSSSIVVQAAPATLVLWIAVNMKVEEAGEFPVEIRALYNDETIQSGKGAVKFDIPGVHFSAIPNILIKDIQKEGMLEFRIRFGGEEEWQTAAYIPVVFKA